MWIHTDMLIGITEASSNLYSAFKICDQHGTAVIMKNNRPVYIVFKPDSNFDPSKCATKIPIRDVTRNFSAAAIKIYDAGWIVITRRGKPVYLMFDYVVAENSELEELPFRLKGGLTC